MHGDENTARVAQKRDLMLKSEVILSVGLPISSESDSLDIERQDDYSCG